MQYEIHHIIYESKNRGILNKMLPWKIRFQEHLEKPVVLSDTGGWIEDSVAPNFSGCLFPSHSWCWECSYPIFPRYSYPSFFSIWRFSEAIVIATFFLLEFWVYFFLECFSWNSKIWKKISATGELERFREFWVGGFWCRARRKSILVTIK